MRILKSVLRVLCSYKGFQTGSMIFEFGCKNPKPLISPRFGRGTCCMHASIIELQAPEGQPER